MLHVASVEIYAILADSRHGGNKVVERPCRYVLAKEIRFYIEPWRLIKRVQFRCDDWICGDTPAVEKPREPSVPVSAEKFRGPPRDLESIA